MASPSFSFKVQHPDVPDDTFDVIAFKGREHISRPFRYVLRLLSENHELDFAQIVNQPAELVMDHVGTIVPITGIVADVRQVETRLFQGAEHSLYTATFVPALWRLRFYHRSRVFQKLKVGDILERVLSEAGLSVVLALDAEYPTREFTVQYNETDLDFIQRLMEFEGIYYFFSGNRLVVTDARAHEPGIVGNRPVHFEEAKGALTDEEEYIRRFIRTQQIVPEKVRVRDYDYSAFAWEEDLEQATDPSNNGGGGRVGTYYEHGRYMLNDKGWVSQKSGDEPGSASPSREQQVERIAQVRAGELETQRAVVKGQGNAARLRVGHRFELADHPRLDGEYLVTQVRHVYMDSDYTNTFACLAAPTQFRPPRRTPVPRIPGIMTAKVDGASSEPPPDPTSSQYVNNPEGFKQAYEAYQKDLLDQPAYLDEEGRYRLRFPFDTGSGGDPSKPVRMAQPYSGPDYGMHFPNRAETEMVFAYLDGDPDQPLGLSTVPNPWTHSPVKNKKLKLSSQNPIMQGPNAEVNFLETKNVIRTQRGHQLVMDDGDGAGNVGITLQVGSAENAAGRNVYWGSKLELGGYRQKSNLEIGLDSASHVIGWLKSAFARDYVSLVGLTLGAIASQVTTDDYLDDTYGTTTPVGASLFSNKAVSLTGKGGVNITSPNIFGMFSSDLIQGPDSDDPRSYMEAITKFLMNTVWQDVVNAAASEVMDARDKAKKYEAEGKKNPKLRAAFKYDTTIRETRISDLFFTLLQRSGINISSAGELKLASLQSTNIAAGQGGFGVKSYGGIEQKADLDITLDAHQKIKITTKGKPYQGAGIMKAVREVAGKVPPLGKLLAKLPSQARISQPLGKPEESYSIELENENGDILLHTNEKGAVMAEARGTGDVKTFAHKGQLHGWSGKETLLEVGDRAGLTGDAFLDPLADDKVGTRLRMTDKVVDVFGKDQVQLSTMDAQSSESFIKIDKGDQIEIKCGQASIVLKKNGDITFKGGNIKIEGMKDIEMKASNITSKANMNVKLDGVNVKLKASLDATVEGTMVNAKGQITAVKGSLVKIGS